MACSRANFTFYLLQLLVLKCQKTEYENAPLHTCVLWLARPDAGCLQIRTFTNCDPASGHVLQHGHVLPIPSRSVTCYVNESRKLYSSSTCTCRRYQRTNLISLLFTTDTNLVSKQLTFISSVDNLTDLKLV
jgi:hypothetical protein